MKKAALLFLLTALWACTPKKTETTATADSTAVDTMMVATPPAPLMLAFNPMSGFYLNNSLVFTDSTNYFLFSSQQELAKKFSLNKSQGAEIGKTDFLINYMVGVACAPTTKLTTIVMDKVEAGDYTINIYLTIRRGEEQKSLSRPAQIFAIERRSGFTALQFYVNGKEDKVLVLPME